MNAEPRRSIDIALDPARNIVVEACAGSGKTWLLVSRIVRLLLDGVAPGEILAITYTRKAANQLTARLRSWLRILALEDDDTVRAFLAERGVASDQIDLMLQPARCLLENYLGAQPALTINTFHGWFLEVLRRAPLDAGAGGGATLIDRPSHLIDEAWQSFAAKSDHDLARALDRLFEECALSNTERLLKAILNRRAEWWTFTAGKPDPLGFALEVLREQLAVDPDADLRAALMGEAEFVQQIRQLSELFHRGTVTNQRLAGILEGLLNASPRDAVDGLVKALVVETQRRANLNVVKAADKVGAEKIVSQVTDRLIGLLGRETDQRVWHFNAAALRCGVALIDQFQGLKESRNGLDFTDVEWRTWKLLTRSDHAEYLQCKLDARYRHILLDEFQDVNPLQWQILESWIKAAHEAGVGPQLFIVGDPKQSIYRFRRAESRLFLRVADYLVRSRRALRIALSVSWRSSPLILDVVNRVFAKRMDGFTVHSAQSSRLPGRIEVMPLAIAEDASAVAVRKELRNPLDEARTDEETVARQIEADGVATKIRDIVESWELHEREAAIGRRARYSDILLLIRSRTHLPVYERALRVARVPYLSSRRGGLLDALEIADLTALLRFLITPFSDLDLAHTLRSPVFSCADSDLVLLAESGDGSWWRRLGEIVASGHASPALLRAHALLGAWLSWTDRLPVHDLLDRIYYAADLINRYQASVADTMRAQVCGNLTAFLELALAVDAGRYPSLPRFLDELTRMRDGDPQDAPDQGVMGNEDDAVRILTVHGAKGLESPIVFIIDAHSVDTPDRGYDVLLDWPPDAPQPTHFSVYAKVQDRGIARHSLFQSEDQQARQEELNALYVAMTRAKQALIVSGSRRKNASPASWYVSIRDALELSDEGGAMGDDLCRREPPREERSCLPNVSQAVVDSRLQHPLNVGRREAHFSSPQTRRGERVHSLLQFMTPPAGVSDRAWLREMLACDEEEFRTAFDVAQKILQAKSLRRFFDPASYLWAANEWVVMTKGDPRRIDRVVEFVDEVWVLDYKTGESVDIGATVSVAASHRTQLELYRHAVSQLIPGKTVRAALVLAGGSLHVMT